MLINVAIIITTILITIIANSFFEWFVHGKLMHGKFSINFLHKLSTKYFYNPHQTQHHAMYPPRSYKNSNHGDNVNLPWWAAIITVSIMAIPGFLISYFTNYWSIVWVYVTTSTCYFLAYNYVHSCYHIPKDRWLKKTRFYKFMNRYHEIHHARIKTQRELINICVLCPIADFVMRTSINPSS